MVLFAACSVVMHLIRPELRPIDGATTETQLPWTLRGCPYIVSPHMESNRVARELKRGSTELLILALLEERDRHGYEIARQIDLQSEGEIRFHAASLYPTLYRLENDGVIEGRWVERARQRRRRYYRITPAGRKLLARQRSVWEQFFVALNRVARIRPA